MKELDNILLSQKQLKDQFEDYLQNQAFDDFPTLLLEPALYIMRLKGKRIRPLMLLTSCRAFNGNVEEAMGPASAVEIFHNFSLIHDDIIDKADKRRGESSVHKKFGLNKAILTGDAMLLHSFIQCSKGASDKLGDLLRVFNKATSKVIEGEQYDVDFEEIDEVSEEDYMMMIEFKTSVLLAASVQLGAIIAGASPSDQKTIYDFGLKLGLAFQIKDDYLDSYGDLKKFGKRIGGDIIQNKKTYLLVTALKRANPSQREHILSLFDEIDDQHKIESMHSIFDQLDVKKQTSKKMEQLYNESLESLYTLEISQFSREPLLEMANKIYHREY